MAGIYIHIPFCRQKCAYCNFYSVVNNNVETQGIASLQRYTDALISEIILRTNECNETIETIYFGGGTPSLLDIRQVVKIFEVLQNQFSFSVNPEITFEGNPESLSKEYLEDIRKHTPINRLSIGVQSFFEDDLKYLNRKHSPKQAFDAIENARKSGFERLSIDLIYGIPTLTNEKWIKNLQTFFSLDISHVSAYGLTVEPNTILDKQIQHFQTQSPKEEHLEQHYLILREQLKKHNFEAYEISNFCKNKHYSKHNSNYWNLSKYYGFGASAHSFCGTHRSWNVADVDMYVCRDAMHCISTTENLTKEMQYNEYVMTAIRTQWGISQQSVRERFGEEFFRYFQQQMTQIPSDWIVFENDRVFTTEKGALFSDAIAEKLFTD
jgi:oxygen-independent coproporphyrinogen-3 oxidase